MPAKNLHNWMTVLVAMFLVNIACNAETNVAEEDMREENIGVAVLPQIDYGSFDFVQAHQVVASGWRGLSPSGSLAEYWAVKKFYRKDEIRSYNHTRSLPCTEFKKMVCGPKWSGSYYYRATVHQSTLDCTKRQTSVFPPTNATSLLGSGTYQTVDSAGRFFAWTYVSNNVEYWAMHNLIPVDMVSTQFPVTQKYRSAEDFAQQLCAASSVPATWLTAYYTAIPQFCADQGC